MRSAFDKNLPIHTTLDEWASDISLIRMLTLSMQINVSDQKWVKQHESEVKCLGRVLQFLGLAEPMKKCALGWSLTPLFIDLQITAPDPELDWDAPKRTKREALLMDMLYGIVIRASGGKRRQRDQTDFSKLFIGALDLVHDVLYHLNLISEDQYGGEIPAPMLEELFAKAVANNIQGDGRRIDWEGRVDSK